MSFKRSKKSFCLWNWCLQNVATSKNHETFQTLFVYQHTKKNTKIHILWHFGEAMSSESGSLENQENRACHRLRVDLKICLLQSECCRQKGKTPLQCLKDNDVPEDCLALKTAFFECKRSILDMRTRFRGRKGGDSNL